MADLVTEENLAPKKIEKKVVIKCHHCKKSVVDVVKCKKCINCFHPACLLQASKQKNAECIHESDKVRKQSTIVNSDENAEVDLLRVLVKELQSKNQILQENTQLLREKIVFLEQKIENSIIKEDQNIHPAPSSNASIHNSKKIKNTKTAPSSAVEGKVESTAQDVNIPKNPIEVAVIDNTDLLIQQNEKQSMTAEGLRNSNVDENQDDWVEVRSKNKNKNKKSIFQTNRPEPLKGQNENATNLKTATRVTFLFLSGTAPEVTCEDVMNFLKENNLLVAGCRCEKMKTKKQKYCSSFRLAVPQTDVIKYLTPSLWPTGSVINHFRNIQSQNQVTAVHPSGR
ncbi:unnamed protein product [Ceutorhynchus assimilis]|uniref:Uncharacterized protein n=1 Tax=Ceutorhynchus assimilis TaxID=467358 RepID=A0A9N9QIR4_9CUCU|nr:unnamed protein product [Ceutorhynchus assimilis]